MNIILIHPEYLLLMVLMVFAIYYSHFWPKRGNRLKLPITIWGSDRFKARQKGMSFLIFISALFFWFGVFLIILALAEPEKITKEKVYFNKGKDIMILLDESPSMFAKDLGISRFDSSKNKLRQFINTRENDSIGLICYSSQSALIVPATQDYEYLVSQIDSLKYRDDKLGNGTDIGLALAFACYHLTSCHGSQQIIILLTDGVNNSGIITPLEAAQSALQLGIKVYPIAIGSRNERSLLEIENLSGKKTQGEIDVVRNDKLLGKIANITGGAFYESSTMAVLEEVLDSISIKEPSNAEGRIDRHGVSYVPYVVLLSLLFFIINFVIRKIVLREIL